MNELLSFSSDPFDENVVRSFEMPFKKLKEMFETQE